ncbi:amidohydrolase family protein [Sandaracinus amylolyticus]|uniref:Amidohydrolase-related domain-containing protein n=1 Tax=Sandaracinus amylolyticus TaxID=927083 RepID=A0A0F6W8Q9_9BACT|nr:amidohydrolase family protein [Sandaracinus amylolyticus]AKF10267.1 hypothetical protein DB32_007416 [Sandaracinus amylolyticus]
MARKSDPELPLRLPIKLDPCSNGEYTPRPCSPVIARAQRVAHEIAARSARRLGISRRAFLESSCGAAAVLVALNQASGCGGGRYAVSSQATEELALADATMQGDEFVFDVQTHHVDVDRAWYASARPNIGGFLRRTARAWCDEPSWVQCYSRDRYVREVFMDSDTDLAVLSALWGDEEINANTIEGLAETRERLDRLGSRLRIHGIVLPEAHEPARTHERMQSLAERWRVSAWKLYPVWGPEGDGWWLDGDDGMRVIRRGIELGVPLFAVHKGLPLGGLDPEYAKPRDVGPVARAFPDATFLVYHSAYDDAVTEGPHDPRAERGVDALINTLRDHDIGRDGNVYAELGSAWREVMSRPDEAAHLIGKLLVHLGEDRILWGTDSIWYGSPQDQIQAFRTFEITPELQERFGYPALTPAIKAKIFGLNAARVYGVDPSEMHAAHAGDELARAREEHRARTAPSFTTYGPRTRRELLALDRARGGRPD